MHHIIWVPSYLTLFFSYFCYKVVFPFYLAFWFLKHNLILPFCCISAPLFFHFVVFFFRFSLKCQYLFAIVIVLCSCVICCLFSFLFLFFIYIFVRVFYFFQLVFMVLFTLVNCFCFFFLYLRILYGFHLLHFSGCTILSKVLLQCFEFLISILMLLPLIIFKFSIMLFSHIPVIPVAFLFFSSSLPLSILYSSHMSIPHFLYLCFDSHCQYPTSKLPPWLLESGYQKFQRFNVCISCTSYQISCL